MFFWFKTLNPKKENKSGIQVFGEVDNEQSLQKLLLQNIVEVQDKRLKNRLSTENRSICSYQSWNHWCTLWSPQDAHWQKPGHRAGGSIRLQVHCSRMPPSGCWGRQGASLRGVWPDLVWHFTSLSAPRKSARVKSRRLQSLSKKAEAPCARKAWLHSLSSFAV